MYKRKGWQYELSCMRERDGARIPEHLWDVGVILPQGAPKLNWHTMGGIAKRGGIVLQNPYTNPKDAGSLDRPAWVCRDCKRIVMEYW